MTKYLLFVALGLLVWWLWRKNLNAARRADDRPEPRAVERMVQCARCGVNQPISESLFDRGRYYCCAAHLQDGQSTED